MIEDDLFLGICYLIDTCRIAIASKLVQSVVGIFVVRYVTKKVIHSYFLL